MSGWDVLSWVNGTLGGALTVMFTHIPLTEINKLPALAMVLLYGFTGVLIVIRLEDTNDE